MGIIMTIVIGTGLHRMTTAEVISRNQQASLRSLHNQRNKLSTAPLLGQGERVWGEIRRVTLRYGSVIGLSWRDRRDRRTSIFVVRHRSQGASIERINSR
jgi:hypothetical protein